MRSRRVRLLCAISLPVLGIVAVAAGQPRTSSPPGRGLGVAIFNPIEGRVRVLSSRSDGERVAKGDVVCELDAAEFRERIDSQEIAVQALRTGANGTRLAREAAEMELDEYKEGRFVRDLQASEAAIKLAEAELVRHEGQFDWARSMFDKGYVSKAEWVVQQLAFEKAKYALEEAQSARAALLPRSRDRVLRTLMAAIEAARERELAKTAELKRAEVALKLLHNQIAACKVTAPIGGHVRFDATIGPGAVIQDGQVLFRIEPDEAAK